jgi:AAA15 family ATPase/GTPase
MIIKTIKINNFKSIGATGYDDQGRQIGEEGYDKTTEQWGLVLHCNDGMNAFIGKNGSGKSNVFDIIGMIFQEFYTIKNNIIAINKFDEFFLSQGI